MCPLALLSHPLTSKTFPSKLLLQCCFLLLFYCLSALSLGSRGTSGLVGSKSFFQLFPIFLLQFVFCRIRCWLSFRWLSWHRPSCWGSQCDPCSYLRWKSCNYRWRSPQSQKHRSQQPQRITQNELHTSNHQTPSLQIVRELISSTWRQEPSPGLVLVVWTRARSFYFSDVRDTISLHIARLRPWQSPWTPFRSEGQNITPLHRFFWPSRFHWKHTWHQDCLILTSERFSKHSEGFPTGVQSHDPASSAAEPLWVTVFNDQDCRTVLSRTILSRSVRSGLDHRAGLSSFSPR